MQSMWQPDKRSVNSSWYKQLFKDAFIQSTLNKNIKRNMQQFIRFYWVTDHIRKSFNWNKFIRPSSIDFTWLEIQICICGHRYLEKKRYGRGSENQSLSGVTTICLMQCDTSPLHRVDQAVDCGLRDVVPTPLQWLWEVDGYCRELEHTVDPEHPKHAQ